MMSAGEGEASGKEIVVLQDSAQKKTVNLLKRSGVLFLDTDLWPSNSPNLSP